MILRHLFAPLCTAPFALLLAVLLLSAPTVRGQSADKPPESRYAPMHMQSGTWDAAVTFYANDHPSGTAKGVQTNTLLQNGHWIVNQFRMPTTGKFPAYEGHGVWGYDPVAKTWVDTWVDTNDMAVRTSYGFWSDREQSMTWSSKQPNGSGQWTDFRIIEKYEGADKRTLTFYQLGVMTARPIKLVEMVFTRRANS